MKAVVVTRPGGPEVLEVREMPDPKPKPGEVIVRVEAVGVNFADTLSTRGSYPGTPAPPFITGREFAGIVEGHRRARDGLHAIRRCRREDRDEVQAAVAAASRLDLGAVGSLPGELSYRLPGVLESGHDRRRDGTHSMATTRTSAVC